MPQCVTPRYLRYVFTGIVFLSVLTGFAQLPIFKRYYIADIPGLGWLADYFFTFRLHYISAVLFIAVAAYLVTMHWLIQRRMFYLTALGYLRGGLLLLIAATGVLLVFRNLPGYRFSPLFVAVLNFSHLGLVVLFLATALVATMFRQPWLKSNAIQ